MVVIVAPLLAAQFSYGFKDDFSAEALEEPAGVTFTLMAGPDAGVYGIAFGEGVRLKGTPVFGALSISLFRNGSLDSLFSGIDMTIRIQPRGKIEPFIGGGGSFNYAWSSRSGRSALSVIPAEAIAEAASHGGESYWGGHVEAGIRLLLDSENRIIEAFGRYTWSSSGRGEDYWLVGVSTGIGW